jgi:hypothetical protein
MMKPIIRLLCVIVVSALIMSGFFISSASAADIVGQTRTFFVNHTFDKHDRSSVAATLQYDGAHIAVYTEDAYWNRLTSTQKDSNLRAIVRLASNFDTHIYPIETGFWGSEPNPGIDGDPRVTILFHELHAGNGGYFDSTHNLPAAPGRDSNAREMIVLNFDSLVTDFASVFLGHEFQHLISSHQKEQLRRTSDEVWLNETRSEYTATLLQQNIPYTNSSLHRRVQSFLRNPSNSLTEWENIPTDYGIAAVFAEYLAGRYGNKILSSSLQSSSRGIASINDYLITNKYSERFSDIFLDWMVASYLNDASTGQKYAYTRPELSNIHVTPNEGHVLFSGVENSVVKSVKHWQPVWFEYSIGNSLAAGARITLNGQVAEIPIAQLVLTYTDGTSSVQPLTFANGSRTVYIPIDSVGKKLRRIVIVGTYTGSESSIPSPIPLNLTITGTLIDAATLQFGLQIPTPTPSVLVTPSPTQTTVISEGALIKRDNAETESYVIRGIYRRYLRPEIISLYGHLKNLNPLSLVGQIFDTYVTSNYVRAINDEKVYAIWPDGTKHWLNITAKRFSESGRDWNSIFIINEAELNAYSTGVPITQ